MKKEILLELNEVDIDPIRARRIKIKADNGDKKAKKEYDKLLNNKKIK